MTWQLASPRASELRESKEEAILHLPFNLQHRVSSLPPLLFVRSESLNAVPTQGEAIRLYSLKRGPLKHLWAHILKPPHSSIIFSQRQKPARSLASILSPVASHLIQVKAKFLQWALQSYMSHLTSYPPSPLFFPLQLFQPPCRSCYLLWAFALAVPLPEMQILPDNQMAHYVTWLRFLPRWRRRGEITPQQSI